MTRTERLQAEASALGLSTAGIMPQIQARIDAHLESCHDTATAAYAPKAHNTKQGARLPVHPINAAVIEGVEHRAQQAGFVPERFKFISA